MWARILMPDGGRSTFLALWPPRGLRAGLSALADRACGGRPVGPADVHLTVLYLGPLADDEQNRVVIALREVRVPAFRLSLDRLGIFRSGRVFWVGPAIAPASLVLLNALLASLDLPRRAAQAGARRPFRPHVTLVRGARQAQTGVLDPPLSWTVRDLVLAVRAPGGRGVYRRLARWRLGAGGEERASIE